MVGRKGRMGGALALAVGVAAMLPSAAFAQSDLSIDKTDSADPVTTGTQFTYSIAISNGSSVYSESASGITVEDTLPNEVDFVSATPSQGSCNRQGSKRVECSIGTLASGGTATVAIVVRAQRAGTAVNTATVSANTPTDPVPANNTDTEQTVIQESGGATCAGKNVDVLGTAGPDTLTGSPKADVIAGLDGNDTIVGLDGRDIICGGLGNDLLKGQTDGDTVKGGKGNDRVRGAGGDDSLFGNAGDDNIGGGRGNDTLRGGTGVDKCRGGPGKDVRKGCE
jgi:uncharacterized repeat protein (TIGR01451 family)